MKLTIGKKISLVLAWVVAAGLSAMAVFYSGMERTNQALRQIGQRGVPLADAAYELEINVNGLWRRRGASSWWLKKGRRPTP